MKRSAPARPLALRRASDRLAGRNPRLAAGQGIIGREGRITFDTAAGCADGRNELLQAELVRLIAADLPRRQQAVERCARSATANCLRRGGTMSRGWARCGGNYDHRRKDEERSADRAV